MNSKYFHEKACETNDMKTGNKYRDAEEEGYFPAPEEDEYLENERDISRTPPALPDVHRNRSRDSRAGPKRELPEVL